MAALLANISGTLAGTAATAGSIAYNAVVPIANEAGKAAFKMGQEHVIPVVSEAGKAAFKIGQEHVVPVVSDAAQRVGPAVVAAGNWVVEHPGQTAWYASSGLTIVFPGLLAGPLAWATGWSAAGVRGASLAAGYQATAGNVVAGGTFATLTSYGMGGYGVAAVHGATRIGAAVLGLMGVGVGAGVAAVAA